MVANGVGGGSPASVKKWFNLPEKQQTIDIYVLLFFSSLSLFPLFPLLLCLFPLKVGTRKAFIHAGFKQFNGLVPTVPTFFSVFVILFIIWALFRLPFMKSLVT